MISRTYIEKQSFKNSDLTKKPCLEKQNKTKQKKKNSDLDINSDFSYLKDHIQYLLKAHVLILQYWKLNAVQYFHISPAGTYIPSPPPIASLP